MFDFYFFAKIIVLIFLWAFILFCLATIIFGRKIYIALKESEENFNYQARQAATNLSPVLLEIFSYNSNVQKLIGLKKITSSDILFLITPFLMANFNVFKGFKMGMTLTKSFLSKN